MDGIAAVRLGYRVLAASSVGAVSYFHLWLAAIWLMNLGRNKKAWRKQLWRAGM
jgi:hypothetical protein